MFKDLSDMIKDLSDMIKVRQLMALTRKVSLLAAAKESMVFLTLTQF